MVSLIEDKRAIPIYWQSLPKKACSNLPEQKALIRSLLRLFKGYRILVLGDREFHSVKLAIGYIVRELTSYCVKNKQHISVYKISHFNG